MKKIIPIAIAVFALSATTLVAADGKALYAQECAKCHGEDGKGDTKLGEKLGCKDYSDPKVQNAMTDEKAIRAIRDGLIDADGKVLMKPTENVTYDDMKAMVVYMRTFKK